jgi:beta-ketoacyl-acyl-carrier-protein synthase II
MAQKRVVVTGMGVINPLGLNFSSTWQNLLAGKSGIGQITLFDTTGFDVTIAGEAWGFDPVAFMPPKEARRTDRFGQFAIACLQEVLAQSRLVIDAHNATQVGAIVGSGVGGIRTYTGELKVLQEKGPHRVNPFLIPSITVDVPAVQVALHSGAQGPNLGVASACATGADAIGHAFELIQTGHARAMFAGGFEAAVTPIGIAAFDQMRALSHHNHEPGRASRPFDRDRDGFVMSEGGGLLLLEELEFALQRGAEPLAEMLAYAATSDSVHLTTPDMEGIGAGRCITISMQRAGVAPDQVTYINAHGTSTRSGDPAETRAIHQAFGAHARRLPVSSTKSMTGHLLGGAGALEAAICVQATRTGLIPPTINLEHPDPECDLDYVPDRARQAEVDVVLSNSMGFGGHNVTLVFRKYR